jgi:hypothetical protein
MYALVAEMGKIDMMKRLNLNWRNLLRLSFTLNHCLRFRKELRGRTSTRVLIAKYFLPARATLKRSRGHPCEWKPASKRPTSLSNYYGFEKLEEGKTDSAKLHTLPTRVADYYKVEQMSSSKNTLGHPAGFFVLLYS